MLDIIRQPWSWYMGGILIGLTVPTLLLLGNKKFGISSTFRQICADCFPANVSFFKYNWKQESWNLFFATGIIIGAFIGGTLLTNPNAMRVAPETQQVLQQYGITDFSKMLPTEIFNWSSLLTLKGFIFIVVGGFLVGFGTRYAGGCISGHSITGISHLQLPSLIATICFMIGGFFATFFILPFILSL